MQKLSAMTKAINAHSTPKSATSMAIVAITMAIAMALALL